MSEVRYITRVHIAGAPKRGRQLCFRCKAKLVSSANMMTADGRGVSFWETGKYVGVVERADGKPVNPVCYFVMDRDAGRPDEVRCR